MRKDLFTWVMTKQNGQSQFVVFQECEFVPTR